MGSSFVRLATVSAQDAVIAYVPIYAEFYRQLAGIAVPVLSPLSLHVHGTYAPSAGAPTALVARTQYTASLQGIAFGHMLRHCAAEMLALGGQWQIFVSRWD